MERFMTIPDFEKMKLLERYSRVNGPLIQLLNERWLGYDEKDEKYLETLHRLQAAGQEILDLMAEGLL
jgi:hypothetical protein